jgi:hypothetical protein
MKPEMMILSGQEVRSNCYTSGTTGNVARVTQTWRIRAEMFFPFYSVGCEKLLLEMRCPVRPTDYAQWSPQSLLDMGLR